jgi:hypothetical protein
MRLVGRWAKIFSSPPIASTPRRNVERYIEVARDQAAAAEI